VDADGAGQESQALNIQDDSYFVSLGFTPGGEPCVAFDYYEALTGTSIQIIYMGNMEVGFLKYGKPAPTPTPVVNYSDLSNIRIYPNPFNPHTAVNGALKITGVPVGAVVTVNSVSGEQVIRIVAQKSTVLWRGVNNNETAVAPGIYFVSVSYAGRYVKNEKILVVNK
jgi:hypothetical protein